MEGYASYLKPYMPSFMASRQTDVPHGYGSTFQGKSYYYPQWAPQTGIISYIFGFSLFMFVVFLVLVFIHYTLFPVFALSPNDNGFISIPTASDRQLAYPNAPAASDLSGNFKDVPACTYTLGMDVFLSGNFQSSTIPRVILYRSPTRIALSKPVKDVDGHLLDSFPDTNILIWLDSMKNDLFVSVMTTDSSDTTVLETITAIENVPVKHVFRVTVVFTRTFLEVYINGKLEKSMAFKGTLIDIADNAAVFPVVSSIGPSVLISNLAFWPRVLTAREVRAYGEPITNDAFYAKSAF
jgi:hypothetical protein